MKKINYLLLFVYVIGLFLLTIILAYSQFSSFYDVGAPIWTLLLGGFFLIIPYYLIYGIVSIFQEYRKKRRLIISPIFLFIISLLFFNLLDPLCYLYLHIKDEQFIKKVNVYEKVIVEIKENCGNYEEGVIYEKRLYGTRLITYKIKSKKEDELIVFFNTGGPVPNTGGGYLYVSSDKPGNYFKLRLVRVYTQWYRFYI